MRQSRVRRRTASWRLLRPSPPLLAVAGEEGRTGDSLTLSTDRRVGGARPDTANPRTDVPNSTIGEPGPAVGRGARAYSNTLGHASDVFDPGKAAGSGGDQRAFRLVSQRDAAWAGVLSAAVDARK